MTQNHGQSRNRPEPEPDLEPGADRFWGQFSQARAGRGQAAEEDPAEAGEENGATGEPAHGHAGGHGEECLEWCPICRSAELIRTAVPPELRDQAEAFQREAVNVFRAFLTAYSERAGSTGPSPADAPEPDPRGPVTDEPEVTDIPLD